MPISGISQGLGIGGGASATISGSPSGGGGTPFANADSLNLDGTDTYATLDSTITLTGAYSISAWINYEVNTGSGWSFWFGTHSVTAMYIDTVSQKLAFRVGSGYVYSSASDFPKQEWNLLVVTRDASDEVNAHVTNASGTAVVATFTDTNDPSIARLWRAPPAPNNLYFAGGIDEIAVWNGTELSAAQIATIYNSGAPDDLTSFSPTHWWRCGDSNGGTGTDITDVVAGNDMTLANTSIVSSVP